MVHKYKQVQQLCVVCICQVTINKTHICMKQNEKLDNLQSLRDCQQHKSTINESPPPTWVHPSPPFLNKNDLYIHQNPCNNVKNNDTYIENAEHIFKTSWNTFNGTNILFVSIFFTDLENFARISVLSFCCLSTDYWHVLFSHDSRGLNCQLLTLTLSQENKITDSYNKY